MSTNCCRTAADQQRVAWSHATTSFALFQATAAYGFSWLFAHTGGDYLPLFAIGGGAMLLALAIDFAPSFSARKR